MYIFRNAHFLMDNQLVYSSLGKTTSPTPNFPQLPTVLIEGCSLAGFSLYTLTCSLVLFLVNSCLGSHVGKTSGLLEENSQLLIS